MSSIELSAGQLREIAREYVNKSNVLYEIKEKIYNTACEGKAYLKTGFQIKYLKELKEYCKEQKLLFKDQGNDGSGSLYTTILIDWSVDGGGSQL